MKTALLAGLLTLASPAAASAEGKLELGAARAGLPGGFHHGFIAVAAPAAYPADRLVATAKSAGKELGGMLHPFDSRDLVLSGALRHLDGVLGFLSQSGPVSTEAAAGASYDARLATWRLRTRLEAAVPCAGGVYGTLAVEASRRLAGAAGVSIRFGYQGRRAAGAGTLAGLSSGVGVRGGPFSIDAEFEPKTVSGETVRLSVAWRI
ncbi:MAG: hypothetical protein HY553_19390 [Elusimicrobia bacterium]|nr:hypothetical protein [Elusimicrobiota bacterium]